MRGFNESAKFAFTTGIAPTLLKAKSSFGSKSYRHSFSSIMSGFRIIALSGRELSKSEKMQIGKIIVSNTGLVRKLISLGWDTLEVQDSKGKTGLKWELTKYADLGGFIGN
jgi:hypothetical protein